MKRFSIKTLGCRLNQSESATMAGSLIEHGWEKVDFGNACEAVIVHSCTITAKAMKKTVQYCRASKKRNPSAVVIVAGCAVQVDGEALLKDAHADILLNQSEKWLIADILAKTDTQSDTNKTRLTSLHKQTLPFITTTRAIVKIQDGCDFRCSYCIVPDARGSHQSRPAHEILNEIEQLANNNFHEIVLTGANIGCYSFNNMDLVDLIESIENQTSIERIRLSSIEPTTAENKTIQYMATSSKLCRSLHVPLQSGSNTVLKRMRRKYSREKYARFVTDAINKVPRLGLGTDVIAGFPGETDSEFQDTLSMLNDLPFSNIHAFSYSPRPGTPAAQMNDQIHGSVAAKRVSQLRETGQLKREIFARSFINRKCSVLLEKRTGKNTLSGWTSEYVAAQISDPYAHPNQIVNFKPASCNNTTLT